MPFVSLGEGISWDEKPKKPRVVRTVYRDAAGNISHVAEDEVGPDWTPPAGVVADPEDPT